MFRQLAWNMAIRLVSSSTGADRKWLGNRASEPASIANNSSTIGLNTAASAIVSTRTVILAAGRPSFPTGTSGCQSCRTAPDSRRCALRWSLMSSHVNVGALLNEGQNHDARTATNRCRLRLPRPTSKATRRAPQKAGAGSGTGAEPTASSSKNDELRTISCDRQLAITSDYTLKT